MIKTPEQRVLINCILPFIPEHHKVKLKSLINNDSVIKRSQIKTEDLEQSSGTTRSGLYNYKPLKTKCDSSAQTDTGKIATGFKKRYEYLIKKY